MIITSATGFKKGIYRYSLYIAVCLTFSFLLSFPVSAAETDPLETRIEKLEKELNDLKLLLQQQKDETAAKAKEDAGKQKPESPVVSSFKFKPYGYIKLDAVYDDSRTNYGNYILYVPTESTKKNDNEFSMTARQTRLGVDITAPAAGDWTAQGKIEIDFYGDGPTVHENKAEIMLRQAFLTLTKGNFSLLAGQMPDLISPLNPSTLNYTVGWSAGNIGYRRPQIQMSYNATLTEMNRLITGLSIARTKGLINEDLDGKGQNDGEESGVPTVEARIALATKSLTEKESTFGISGHYGKETINWSEATPGDKDQSLKSWSLNFDFDIPVTGKFSIKGEVFKGANLDDYFGGALQGINKTTRKVIKTTGGWAQAGYKLTDKWQYYAGLGVDNPSDKDLNSGDRAKNGFIFLNAQYKPISPVTIGLEFSHWKTEYVNGVDGTDNRFQAAFIYTW
jgi:hypothetical protein